MKKSFVLLVSVILSVLFLSCESKSKPGILGKWEAKLTLRSELASKADGSQAPQAYLYTKQTINLIFAEGGTYTRKILQTVDKVELLNSSEDPEAAKEYFSQYYNKDLTFDGDYIQEASAITFNVDTVQGGNDEPLSYEDFFVKDPSIGDDSYSSEYELKDGFLFVDGIKFKKVEQNLSAVN